MRTWVVSHLSAVSVEAIESINAELRRGGPLVGRMSRRVSQSGLRKNPDSEFQPWPSAAAREWARPAALCVKALKYLEFGTENLDMWSSAVRIRFYIQEPGEEPHQAPGTHFPDEPVFPNNRDRNTKTLWILKKLIWPCI